MEGLRQYVVSVTTAAIICGMLTATLNKGAVQSLVKLLCGFFLAFTFLSPIGRLNLKILPEDFGLDYEEASDAAQEGERFARNSVAQIIKEQTEAYILDKAAELGLSLEAEVFVSGDEIPIPESVRLAGHASELERGRMEIILEKDLGIAKENQIWTG